MPPMEGNNSLIPKEGGPSMHYSDQLYPVPYLYDYVSLVYLKIRSDGDEKNKKWKGGIRVLFVIREDGAYGTKASRRK